MKIKDYSNLCELTDCSTQELLQVGELLRIADEGRFFSPAFKSNRWDGYHHFYNRKHHTFPAGLLSFVQRRFPYASYSDCATQIPVLNKGYEKLKTLTPREDQLEVIKKALESRRGIIQAPTSFGKTVCLAMLSKAISGDILIVTHTRTLLHQTAKVLEKELGEKIGIIGDGIAQKERVTIGLVRSLENVDMTHVNAILVDECHRCSADGLYKLLLSIPAYYRYGVSADPLDEQTVKANSSFKKFRIIACFGPIVALSTMADAKERGIIATPIITMTKIADPYKGLFAESEYAEAYDKLTVENVNLEAKIVSICNTHSGEQVMILLKRLAHGQTLATKIPNSRFLSGEDDSADITSGIKDFKKGKFSVLIGSDIFKEGVDIPEIDVLINAGGDVAATKQRLGRGLRKRADKESIQVYDFLITGSKHTEKHSKERLRVYLSEGHEVNGFKSA